MLLAALECTRGIHRADADIPEMLAAGIVVRFSQRLLLTRTGQAGSKLQLEPEPEQAGAGAELEPEFTRGQMLHDILKHFDEDSSGSLDYAQACAVSPAHCS